MGFSLHPLLCMIQLHASGLRWRYEVGGVWVIFTVDCRKAGGFFLIDYCFMWNMHVLDTARLYSDACINRSQGQKDWENVCWEIVEDIK